MKRLAYERVKEEFEKRGYVLLEKEYINAKQKLKFHCPKHPDKDNVIDYGHLQSGRGCRYCGFEKGIAIRKTLPNRNPRKLNIDFMKRAFDERGLVLLETKYYNNQTKMKYKCLKHPGKIYEVSWASLQTRKGCPLCASNARLDYDFVKEIFTKRGYQLISTTYKNGFTPLEYRCPKHPNEPLKIAFAALYHLNNGCKFCSVENRKGENSYNWKGGTATLSSTLRNTLSDWKMEYLDKYNHKCFVTGVENEKLIVHHTKMFNIVVKEALSKLDLPLKMTREYSDDELDLIISEIKELHNSIEGVPMTVEVHRLFHAVYGNISSNFNDVIEFKERFYKGEFKNIILDKIKRLEDIKEEIILE